MPDRAHTYAIPAPIIPAPSTTTFCAVYFGTSFGRSPPLLMCCRSNQSALTMFVLTGPVTRSTKYCVSIASAVAKSTWAPSTAAAMMWCGAGIGAPLICLRRFAGNAGRLAANAGVIGVPPGILYPLTSQGCTASRFDSAHVLAAWMSSSGVLTSSSTTPAASASFGLRRCPWSRWFISAVWMPNIRTERTTPPPPGRRPHWTSGKPNSAPFTSRATRWWQARASSSPPPRAAPLSAATTGRPRVSMRRKSALSPSHSSVHFAASSLVVSMTLLRSAPAKNVFFPDVRTTPLIFSFSDSSRSTVAVSDLTKISFIVFTGAVGSSIVRVTIPASSISQPNMFDVSHV